MIAAFSEWSPAQLAFVLGYRIDLRSHGMSGRSAYFVRPSGRAHVMGHSHACDALSRLAAYRGIDPTSPPTNHPRALIDGREQA